MEAKITSFGIGNVQDISSLENSIGFNLPKDYCDFLLRSDGCRIEDGYVFVEQLKQSVLLKCLFSIKNEKKVLTIGHWMNEYGNEIPEKSIIIGNDQGGSFLLFITIGDEKGIYFWDDSCFFERTTDEKNIYLIAGDFSAFLDKIANHVID